MTADLGISVSVSAAVTWFGESLGMGGPLSGVFLQDRTLSPTEVLLCVPRDSMNVAPSEFNHHAKRIHRGDSWRIAESVLASLARPGLRLVVEDEIVMRSDEWLQSQEDPPVCYYGDRVLWTLALDSPADATATMIALDDATSGHPTNAFVVHKSAIPTPESGIPCEWTAADLQAAAAASEAVMVSVFDDESFLIAFDKPENHA